jgi:putative endonuclease
LPVFPDINSEFPIFTAMERGGAVYMMTNVNDTVIYVGATSNLISRVYKHKTGFYKRAFSLRYNLTKLVYFEIHQYVEEAFAREKQLKAGSRKKKEMLINSMNPKWKDLYPDLINDNL